MAHLLNPGEQQMWWCPSCGCVLHKPPKVHEGERFHSWKCPLPMVWSTITVKFAVPDQNGSYEGEQQ